MFELRVLGSVELLAADGSPVLSVLSQPKRFVLLAYLALVTPRGFQRRDRLLALFWPDADEAHARRSLNQALYHLRRCFGEQVIATRTAEDVGVDWSRLRCDVGEFREAVRGARWEEALALYRGELLPGFHADTSAELEQWLDAERTELRAAAARAAVELSSRAEAVGDVSGAVEYLRRARAIEPEREAHVERLLELLDRSGDREGALKEYETYTARLATEFETGPMAALRQLADRLRRSPPPPRPLFASAGPAPVVSVKRHRRQPTPTLVGIAVAIAAIAMGALAVALLGKAEAVAPHDAASLAVLPLRASPGSEDFADGLTAQLIETLGHVPRLRVPGPAASYQFQGKNIPPQQVAAELGVGLILEGDVRHDDGSFVVSVRLTSPATGRRLWSHSYENGTAWRVDLQRRIARDVGALLTFAAPGWLEQVADSAVYDAYLQALLASDPDPAQEGTPAATSQVPQLEQYRRLLQHSPDFVQARAGMAFALTRAGDFDEALQQAEAALAVDSTLVIARAARATVLGWGQWQWEAAERELDRAIELAPWWARLYHQRANIRYQRGQLELAMSDLRRAELLDPLSDELLVDKAAMLASAGEYTRALTVLQGAIRADTTAYGKETLVSILIGLGRRSEAAALQRSRGLPRFAIIASGDTAELRALLSRAQPLCIRGSAAFELGIDEPMLDCLANAVAERHRFAPAVLRNSYYAQRLQRHPRFQRLLEQVYGSD